MLLLGLLLLTSALAGQRTGTRAESNLSSKLQLSSDKEQNGESRPLLPLPASLCAFRLALCGGMWGPPALELMIATLAAADGSPSALSEVCVCVCVWGGGWISGVCNF